nr:bifunctional dihydrofolate reductase-thymidylate synthase isoform X1 [Tanacetum cinerariifolium]
PTWQAPDGVLVAHSLPEALALAATQPGGDEVCVIGGGEIYRQALPGAAVVHLTEVHTTVADGDTFFPTLSPTEWREETRHRYPSDERHAVAYSFVTLRRSSTSLPQSFWKALSPAVERCLNSPLGSLSETR